MRRLLMAQFALLNLLGIHGTNLDITASIAEVTASGGDNVFTTTSNRLAVNLYKNWTAYQRGVIDCPCLAPDDTRVKPIVGSNGVPDFYRNASIDFETYGFGCGTHDLNLSQCLAGCSDDSNISPPSIDCDRSWCERNWCWVDPDDCKLQNRRSINFPESDRFFSYATCWDMDFFTQNNRLNSLRGRVLRAGFNSNTGGWLGAYGAEHIARPNSGASNVAKGTHFLGPVSRWSGPLVSFVTEAARTGSFLINITAPPASLKPHSEAYFGPSNFDFCVYATALGYLDFCVAQYTVTDVRASTTDWLLLGTQDLYMIVPVEEELNGWDRFINQTKTIFQPFTAYTWLFIVVLVIPILGGLMVVHELGHAGSAFPKMESIVEIGSEENGVQHEIKERKVPIYRHLIRSIYIAFLAVLQQDYSQSVVTYGAMMHLLGISFFILTIIAVYTANLAAILSQQPKVFTVSTLSEATKLGLKICVERKNLNIVRLLNPDVPDSVFVNDPLYLGGDGLPGFSCANCSSRTRVFNMIRFPAEVAKNDSYCNVAIAPLEDLQSEHQQGSFCNIEASNGGIVGQVQTGIPVYEGVSEELVSLFLKLKNDGVYDKEVLAAKPDSQCPVVVRGEGSPLSVSQLTGIWVVSFGFAMLGLMVTFLTPVVRRYRKTNIQPVIGYDQSGNRINLLEHDDEQFLNDKTFTADNGKIFVSGSSRSTVDVVEPQSQIYTIDLNDNSNASSIRLGDDSGPQRRQYSSSSERIQRRESRPDDDYDDEFKAQDGRNYRYL